MDTNLSRTTPQRAPARSRTRPASEKTGPAEQAAWRAEVHHDRVARRAYELYEQRGRQEGRALEDWLNAERQLVSASGTS